MYDFVMKEGLKYVNNSTELNRREIFYEMSAGEQRTARIEIRSDSDWHQQLGVYDLMYEANQDAVIFTSLNNPTITWALPESAFIKLINQEVTLTDLFHSSKIKCYGEYFIRDFVVWSKFWREYKKVIHLSRLQKILLRSKDYKDMPDCIDVEPESTERWTIDQMRDSFNGKK